MFAYSALSHPTLLLAWARLIMQIMEWVWLVHKVRQRTAWWGLGVVVLVLGRVGDGHLKMKTYKA